MKIGSAIAIYFLVWWTVLFAILPIGVRNAHESGEDLPEGHDSGAPVKPQLVKKAVITTIVSTVIFAGVYYLLTTQLLAG